MMVKPSVFVTRRWPAAVEAQLAEDYNVAAQHRRQAPVAGRDPRGAETL